MTPAENPREIDRSRLLVFLAKKAKALPIPVERPANRVSPKANKTVFVSTINLQDKNILLFLLIVNASLLTLIAMVL
jgi:hypothetical protein